MLTDTWKSWQNTIFGSFQRENRHNKETNCWLRSDCYLCSDRLASPLFDSMPWNSGKTFIEVSAWSAEHVKEVSSMLLSGITTGPLLGLMHYGVMSARKWSKPKQFMWIYLYARTDSPSSRPLSLQPSSPQNTWTRVWFGPSLYCMLTITPAWASSRLFVNGVSVAFMEGWRDIP